MGMFMRRLDRWEDTHPWAKMAMDRTLRPRNLYGSRKERKICGTGKRAILRKVHLKLAPANLLHSFPLEGRHPTCVLVSVFTVIKLGSVRTEN